MSSQAHAQAMRRFWSSAQTVCALQNISCWQDIRWQRKQLIDWLVDWLIDSCFGYLKTTLLAVNSITTYMMVVCGIHENKLACKHIRIMFIVGNVDRYNDCYSGRSSSWHSIDTRSTLGRYSVDCRSTVDWHSIDTPSIVDRQSVDGRSTCMSADISFQVTDTSLTLGRHFADTWPILDQHFADTSHLTDTRHNQPTHYWRSCDLKWVLIKHISLRT